MKPVVPTQNLISIRIADFLKEFPPFSYLAAEKLLELSAGILVKYLGPGETLFEQESEPGDHFYVVNQGAVKLVRNDEGTEILFNICDEGDIFGIRPLLASQPYLSSAIAQEETILYCVHKSALSQIFESNPKASFFLAKSFASGSQKESPSGTINRSLMLLNQEPISQYYKLAEIQKIDIRREPICCDASTSIEKAAHIMTEHNVGSIVVADGDKHPIGIITDSDLRRKVATYKISRQEPVSSLMTSPVLCISNSLSIADAQIEMIKHDVNHLVITEDGTDQSQIEGVLAQHDLVVMQGNNPVILIKEIKSSPDARSLKQIRDKADILLKNYIYQEVAISFVSEIMTEITDALMRRCIEIALSQMARKGKKIDTPFAWLSIGSHGRGEQLIRTDQDSALIFEDVPIGQYNEVKNRFAELAKIVVDLLKECGYSYCPADMMASNPKWCLSLFEWKEQFSKWIENPNEESILYSSIFMDYRTIYGVPHLAEDLSHHIVNKISDKKKFLTFLAKSVTETPPPLGFFRTFIVEKDGHHKNEFDIKQRAMLPLIDIARVFILEGGILRVNNTIKRYAALAEADPGNASLYQDAAESYEIMMKLRATQGIENDDSGRYFDPKKLNKIQRLLLRSGFKPISRLQEILNIRYQLKFIFR